MVVVAACAGSATAARSTPASTMGTARRIWFVPPLVGRRAAIRPRQRSTADILPSIERTATAHGGAVPASMSEIRQTPRRPRAYTSDVDFETAYRAVESRDGRFDGRVFCGVLSTGVYCRPICPVPMPQRNRVRFFPTAAAAEDAGFRACRRCRPEASPDSPDWDVRADLVGRGLRLIADGRRGRRGRRGAGPAAGGRVAPAAPDVRARSWEPARSRSRARAGPAWRSSCSSRPTCRAPRWRSPPGSGRCGSTTTPFAGRTGGRRPSSAGGAGATTRAMGGLTLRLAARPPFAADALLAFLGARAVPGLEELDGRTFRRSLRTRAGERRGPVAHARGGRVGGAARRRGRADRARPGGPGGPAAVRPRRGPGGDRRRPRRGPGAPAVGARDARPAAAGGGRSVRDRRFGWCSGSRCRWPAPGRSAPGWSRGSANRWSGPPARVTHLFPSPAALAEARLDGVGLTRSRAETVRRLAEAVAVGKLDLSGGGDLDETLGALGEVPGVGPWTCDLVAMRVLRAPRRVPGDRPGSAPRRRGARAAPGAGGPPRPGRILASVARLRRHAPVAGGGVRPVAARLTRNRSAAKTTRPVRQEPCHAPVPASAPQPPVRRPVGGLDGVGRRRRDDVGRDRLDGVRTRRARPGRRARRRVHRARRSSAGRPWAWRSTGSTGGASCSS